MNKFEQLVLEMRSAQCDYFRNGGYRRLVEMQQLQSSVDQWLWRRQLSEMTQEQRDK